MNDTGSRMTQLVELPVAVLQVELDGSRSFGGGAANLRQLELDAVRNVDPHAMFSAGCTVLDMA